MPHLPRILLINPTMTSRRSARFPLALLHLSAALDRTMAASSQIIDGNVARDFITATLRALESDRFDLVGITVMGGPQLAPAIAGRSEEHTSELQSLMRISYARIRL